MAASKAKALVMADIHVGQSPGSRCGITAPLTIVHIPPRHRPVEARTPGNKGGEEPSSVNLPGYTWRPPLLPLFLLVSGVRQGGRVGVRFLTRAEHASAYASASEGHWRSLSPPGGAPRVGARRRLSTLSHKPLTPTTHSPPGVAQRHDTAQRKPTAPRGPRGPRGCRARVSSSEEEGAPGELRGLLQAARRARQPPHRQEPGTAARIGDN